MIVVTFALPQESQDFVRALKVSKRRGEIGEVSGSFAGEDIVVAHTGVGAECAAKCMQELFKQHRPEMLISAGFAGGLHPSLRVGDLLAATNFSSAALLSSLTQLIQASASPLPAPMVFAPLSTQTSAVESIVAKVQLASTTGAYAVDMETGLISEACIAANIPLLSLRVISDSAADALPVPMHDWFDMKRQRPRPLALLAYLARHPNQIAPFARFVSGLAPARRLLTRQLLEIIPLRLSDPAAK